MKQRLLSARATRNLWHYGLMGIALAVLTVFLLYPIALTVGGGFLVDPAGGSWTRAQDWTIRHISDALADPKVREGLFNSLKIATGTTTLAILLALPLAVLSAKYRFAGKGFFNAAILVPLILPPFVGAIGVKAILGRQGALNAALAKVAAGLESIGLEGGLTRWLAAGFDVLGEAKYWGVVAVQALALYPIIYLNATASLANLDPRSTKRRRTWAPGRGGGSSGSRCRWCVRACSRARRSCSSGASPNWARRSCSTTTPRRRCRSSTA